MLAVLIILLLALAVLPVIIGIVREVEKMPALIALTALGWTGLWFVALIAAFTLPSRRARPSVGRPLPPVPGWPSPFAAEPPARKA